MTARAAPAPFSVANVARHYDELDSFYREVWGDHLHHGLWRTGDETPERAVTGLVEHVAGALALRPGEMVVDVGAGYGATARHLVSALGVEVVGLTVSAAQHAYSVRMRDDTRDNPRMLLRDWLSNGLAAGWADAVLAIESTEHMADLPLALEEMRRVLRPGGRFAVCAWLAGDAVPAWQRRFLLEAIRREGRLVTLATASEYAAELRRAGFERIELEDLTARVRRTWPACVRRLAGRFLTDTRYWRYALGARNAERVFLATIFRIQMAYATGAMRYGLFVGTTPA
jgi:tocopherol O-methyltransferase